MEYIIVFFFSIFFAHLADIYLNSRNRILGKIFLIISALLPILLAGFRDITVGTDTSNYYEKFMQALNSQTFERLKNISDMEIGYVFVSYLCSKISNNQIFYFTIVHSLVIIPVYVAIYKCRSHVNCSTAIFVYYFSFFCSTLNITRQGIALSFTLLSLAYLLNNANKKSLICFLLAFLFHKTSLLFIIIYIVYYFVQKYNVKEYKFLYIFSSIIFAGCAFIVVKYTNTLDIIISGREQYESYFNEEGSISRSSLLLYIFIMFLIFNAYVKCSDKLIGFFMVVSTFSVIFIFLSIFAQPLSRLSSYFSIVQVLSLPIIFNNHYINSGKKVLLTKSYMKYGYFLLIILYWYFSIITKQSNEVYPYIITSY